MNTPLQIDPYVPLPEIDEALLHRLKVSGSIWSDSRRYARMQANAHCLLKSENTYASAGREKCSQGVLLRDVSRSGASFVHGAQLFPGERCLVFLAAGKCLRLEIVWCRKIAPGTFLSGCAFHSGDLGGRISDQTP